MAQYACVSVTAGADENVVPLVFEEFSGHTPIASKCKLQFVGFEAESGTAIRLNGMPNKVPSTGYFITPYDSVNHMTITQLSFDEGCSDLNIWFIF